MTAPGVRTHSVREVVDSGRWEAWECRGCGQRWLSRTAYDRASLERLPCGTRAPDPGSEAETNG